MAVTASFNDLELKDRPGKAVGGVPGVHSWRLKGARIKLTRGALMARAMGRMPTITPRSLRVIATSRCIIAACTGSSITSARSWQVSEARGHQGEEEDSLEHLTELWECVDV